MFQNLPLFASERHVDFLAPYCRRFFDPPYPIDPPYNHGHIQNLPHHQGILPLGGQIVCRVSFLNHTLAKWLA
jgi:hypothetical protein